MAELVDAGDLKSPVIRIFLFSFCAVPVLFSALSHSSQADLGGYMRQLRTFFSSTYPLDVGKYNVICQHPANNLSAKYHFYLPP